MCLLVTKLCPTLCNPWTLARQASVCYTISRSLVRFMSIESIMLSNLLILCCPLLLLPSIFPVSGPFQWVGSYHQVANILELQHQTFQCLIDQTFQSLIFNMLSRLVITFLPRSKHLLISWLQSPSAVILEPKTIKSNTVSTFSPSVCHEAMGLDAMIFVFWMLSFKPAFSLSCFHPHQKALQFRFTFWH